MAIKEGREGDTSFLRRIGVFICRCGRNIGGVVDVPTLVKFARTLPWVVHSEENTYTCSDEGLSSITEKVKSLGLTRVVVASCTPRTHEPLFRNTIEKAGLNRYLFEFVNIREGCSWIHATSPESATRKAQDLIAMGVAKVATLEPQDDIEADILQSALVIGGGVAGMSAAVGIASLCPGVKVHLLEKEGTLGGFVRRIESVHPSGQKGKDVVSGLEKEIAMHKEIKVHLRSKIVDLKGYAGNFRIKIRQIKDVNGNGEESIDAGVIIVAAGAVPFEPNGLFLWKQSSRVITSFQLEDEMSRGIYRNGSTIFLNCAHIPRLGSSYCGRICCGVSMKQAQKLQEHGANPVVILGRNQMAWGEEWEEEYRKGLEKGVRVIRFSDDNIPQVSLDGEGRVVVKTFDELSGENFIFYADNLVLGVPLVPDEEFKTLSRFLKVPLEQSGFFKEKHPKLAPVEFGSAGIFLCGSCRFPSGVEESIVQGKGAAGKASSLLRAGSIRVEACTAKVDSRLCSGCGFCADVCPYEAITIVQESETKKVARVNEPVCKGCGSCAATCLSGAMDQRVFSDRGIRSMIKASARRKLLSNNQSKPLILVFACNWCSYAGSDLAGVSRFEMLPDFRIIRVMCSGRVRAEWVFEALMQGIDGVLILGCHPGECHYEEGNLHAHKRIETLRNILPVAGIDPRRVRIDWVSAGEAKRFKEIIEEMIITVKDIMTPSKVE